MQAEPYWVVKFPDSSYQNWEKLERTTALLPEAAEYATEEEAQEAADSFDESENAMAVQINNL